MKPEQIFIGNIRKCTKYDIHNTFTSQTYIGEQCIGSESFGYIDSDDELYKEDAILIEIKNGGYVDIDNINSIIDHIKIRKDISKRDRSWNLGGLMMSTSPHKINSLFVEYESLKPYYENLTQEKKNISVKKLKKQIQAQKNN